MGSEARPTRGGFTGTSSKRSLPRWAKHKVLCPLPLPNPNNNLGNSFSLFQMFLPPVSQKNIENLSEQSMRKNSENGVIRQQQETLRVC